MIDVESDFYQNLLWIESRNEEIRDSLMSRILLQWRYDAKISYGHVLQPTTYHPSSNNIKLV